MPRDMNPPTTPTNCTLWKDTDGHCCPDGTHRTDCLFRQKVQWSEHSTKRKAGFPYELAARLFFSHVLAYGIGVAVTLYLRHS